MSESKHTPGTWMSEGLIVTACEGRLSIAEVHDHSETSDMHTTIEAEANVRLIAAAPDLLAACEYAIEKMRNIKGKTFPILPILNAIAKAKKEQ